MVRNALLAFACRASARSGPKFTGVPVPCRKWASSRAETSAPVNAKPATAALPTDRLRWNVAGSHRDDGAWAWGSWPGARNPGNLPATVKPGRAALSRGWGEAVLAGREPCPDPSPAVPEQPAV